METFKSIYFSQIAEQHFGKTMGKIISTLQQYGPINYQDILKYLDFDNHKFLEIAITLGIKHQIIGHEIKSNTEYTDYGKKTKKQKLIFANNQGLLGREYFAELLVTESDYIHLLQYAYQNGIFGIENLINQQYTKEDIENQINSLVDKSLLLQVSYELPVETFENIQSPQKENKKKQKYQQNDKDDKNDKNEQKDQSNIKKQKKSKQKEEKLQQKMEQVEGKQLKTKTDIKLYKINWVGVLDYLKKNAILQQLKKINKIQNDIDKIQFQALSNELKYNLYLKWINDKFSPRHSRIINMLKIKGTLDEKQICDLSLLRFQDSTNILLELIQYGLLKTEIQRQNEKEKQIYLYDEKMIEDKLQLIFYKSLINCRDKKLYFGILNQMHLMQFKNN